MIKKYRKKQVEIEAVQWTGDNLAELRKMDGFNSVHTCFGGRLNIKTLEGIIHASVGDYIIKGVQGEFYPCKPDIFEQTYDESVPKQSAAQTERMCYGCHHERYGSGVCDFCSRFYVDRYEVDNKDGDADET